ncbi:hypothetical protein M8J76_016919 [Diaphorina citri]|nr:hypothetical protein M8J76_016919 [Diaphorina citri]
MLVCSENSQLILGLFREFTAYVGVFREFTAHVGVFREFTAYSWNSNKRGAGDRRKVKIKIQKMKPRRNAATTGPRNSTLQTVRTLPDISECSSDNLLEQLKYFAENPVDNLDMIVSISSRLYLKITSQENLPPSSSSSFSSSSSSSSSSSASSSSSFSFSPS